MIDEPRIFTGHDPDEGPDGTDFLLTVYLDGTRTIALRPGKDRTSLRWGAPVQLEVTA